MATRDHEYWKRRITNNAATALMVFTFLHIICFSALSGYIGSNIVTYIGLGIIVLIVIPAFSRYEARWHGDAFHGQSDYDLAMRFHKERIWLWILAITMPFIWTALYLVLYRILA